MIRVILLLAMLLCFSTPTVNASLIHMLNGPNSDPVIYDSDTGLYWYQLSGQPTNLSYTQTLSYINNALNVTQYAGLSDWTFATLNQVTSIFIQLSDNRLNAFDLFTPWQSSVNQNGYRFYSWDGLATGTLDGGVVLYIRAMTLTYTPWGSIYRDGYVSTPMAVDLENPILPYPAWICAVPEPSTYLLLLLGIIALSFSQIHRRMTYRNRNRALYCLATEP